MKALGKIVQENLCSSWNKAWLSNMADCGGHDLTVVSVMLQALATTKSPEILGILKKQYVQLTRYALENFSSEHPRFTEADMQNDYVKVYRVFESSYAAAIQQLERDCLNQQEKR